jgi:uncharacterized protein (DUF433 family)
MYSGCPERIAQYLSTVDELKYVKIPTMENVIEVNSEKLGGTPVFAGTRVPIQNLFDYIEGGETLDDFLEGFPPVTREQAITVLELAKASLLIGSAKN